MMKAFYNLFLLLYPLGARIVSFKNEKAKKWLAGRKGIFDKLSVITHDQPVIWVHCSSLGEFEQGKPLIEKLPQQFPRVKILLTFFSPSGYEVQKDYKGADHIFYLPMDSAANAKRFFDIVNPALIIFIKYEFWHYYISAAKKRNIPLVLASAVFRESQPFFQWYGGFHRKMLQSFSYLFVQDENSVELLNDIHITNVAVTGDTRFDRVLAIAKSFQPIDIIDQFCGSHPVIVAGSTWTEDDEELDHYANTNPHIRFIIAPHDISQARIDECLSLYKNAITFSELNQTNNVQRSMNNVLIIDNIGLLSKLYHYATIAYIGGGFGADGVHNVLEAAVYGKPVVFGPEYDKYIEAVQLVEAGGAFPIASALELEKQLNELFDDEFLYKQACLASKDFVAENAGATEKIVQYIQEKRLFTTLSKSLTV
jgi:3-deoxy-D-manno-octulosonic-acid transferase